jgi:membrane protease YdiL (CAAX protease family)
MPLKNIKVSPYLSISAIVLLYVILSGALQSVLFFIENDIVKYGFAFIGILFFTIITYYINNYYFKKINLEPQGLIKINTALLTSILIGISFAVAEVIPYRIYAVIKTGVFEYIFMAFTIENILIALGAGITEEIIARGTLLNFFKQQNKRHLGLVISSLFFGLMHMTNAFVGMEISFVYIGFLVISGFTLGLIYLNFGIVAVITSHTLYNLFVTGFTTSTQYGFYYTLSINCLICIWLFFRDRKKQINHLSISTKADTQ